jgi:hypothetical protein
MPFYFSQPVTGVQPYVYFSPNTLTPPITLPFAITLYLENIFTNPPAQSINVPPFTIAPTKSSPMAYTLTIDNSKASIAWQFDSTPIRQALSQAFLTFILQLEQQGLLPGRSTLVQQLLAQNLPLTFAETLYYQYGFNPASGYINLQPGMRLRLDFQEYQEPDPGNPDFLNGFVGTGTSYIEVASFMNASGNLLTGFNPFLAALQSTTVTTNTGGAGGGIDLMGAPYAYPYFRLFYPKSVASADSTGYVGTQENVSLVGASTLSNLNTATQAYLTSGTCSGCAAVQTFFRGRVTVTPEIPVFMLGVLRYVPVGTTIRNLMQGFTNMPYFAANTVQVSQQGQFYSRWLPHAIKNPTTSPIWSPATFDSVQLLSGTGQQYTGGYQYYGSNQDSFDLPVLGGDNVTFTLPS